MATYNAIKRVVAVSMFGQTVSSASEILPGLYIGDASAAADAPDNGFTAIVNCIPDICSTRRDYYDESVNYIEHGSWDTDVLPDDVKNFIDYQLEFGRKVLIHCTSGINISAAVGIAYYMCVENVDVVTAVQHCFDSRQILLTSNMLIRMLVEYTAKKREDELLARINELEERLNTASSTSQ